MRHRQSALLVALAAVRGVIVIGLISPAGEMVAWAVTAQSVLDSISISD
jgi:hypothetical protein